MLNCKETARPPYIQLPEDKEKVKIKSLSAAGKSKIEPIVIVDECGDSLWNDVLEQGYPTLRFANVIF